LTTTDEETAETLKNQYQKIFVSESPFDPSNITVGITDGPSIENVSFDSSKVLHKLQRMTRSSAIAEGPRDVSCQLKSCQLPRNSAETTYTTSPDQTDGMKLEI